MNWGPSFNIGAKSIHILYLFIYMATVELNVFKWEGLVVVCSTEQKIVFEDFYLSNSIKAFYMCDIELKLNIRYN